MSNQQPKRLEKRKCLVTLNLLTQEGSNAKDQWIASDWELSVLEKELGSEHEIEYAPNLFNTSDATAFPVLSNIDQSPVSSNSSIADKKSSELHNKRRS